MNFDEEPSSLRNGARYDVIVVGARAAGASTAMLLGRQGLDVLMVDHGRFGSDTLSTHALMRAGVLQLSRWGLLDRVIAAGTPPIRRTTFTSASGRIVVDISAKHGVDALYAPRRTVLDSILVQAAIDSGVDARDLTSMVDVVHQRERVRGVVLATTDGRFVEVEAPLVIGADGIRSTVARRVGASTVRQGRNLSAVAYGYWTDVDIDGYQWVYQRAGNSGFIPTNDGRVVVFANATAERIGKGGVSVISDMVAAGSPELGERLRSGTAPSGTRTFRGQTGFMRAASGPGWALVGDASHFKDPIGAHGITDALRDAELLARAVVAGGGVGMNIDAALADYGAQRDEVSVPLFDTVEQISGNHWTDDEIGPLLKQLSATMAGEVELLASLDAEAMA